MKFSIQSDIGRKRNSNQDYADYFYSSSQHLLFVLCDGVGGNQAGEVASRQTTEYIGRAFQKIDHPLSLSEMKTWCLTIIQEVNDFIVETASQNEDYEGMGTTLVLVTIIESVILICHVGDSRVYAYQKGQINQLTQDHSLVNELVRTGEISVEESYHHPRRNVVTQSIGVPTSLKPEVTELPSYQVERLLLCSDGLNAMLRDEEIANIMAQNADLVELGQALIEAANQAGGFDNITLILIEALEENLEGGDQNEWK